MKKSSLDSLAYPNMTANSDFPISYRLTGVAVVENKVFGGNELQLDEVQLLFDEVQTIITVRPLPDTDEVELTQQLVTSPRPAMNTPVWCRPFVGQPLQAVWICTNQQGYQDQVIFGFGLLRPSFTFLAEAAVLLVVGHEVIKKEDY